jgi:hypothetical protein
VWPTASASAGTVERWAGISSPFRAGEFQVRISGVRLGGTSENVVPASDLVLERIDESLKHGRDVVVVHR